MGECKDCKHWDRYGFCEAVVVDTRRCRIEDGIRSETIKAYYLAERQEDDDRSAFIAPSDFGCNLFIKR